MNKKYLNYGDRESQVALWLKSITLMPLWGFLLLPIMGAFFNLFGELPLNVGYTLALLMCTGYFAEDLLKRRITIQDQKLYFGYRQFDLSQLASIGLTYHRNRAIPNKLIMNFVNGRKLKLALGRLNADDLDMLVGLIDNKVQHCQIDPVLRTLSRCKKLARDTSLDSEDLIEIPYGSRVVFKQLLEVFMTSASKWKRAGPIVIAIVAAPVWLSITKTLYTLIPAAREWAIQNRIAMYDSLAYISKVLDETLATHTSTAAESVGHYLANPVAACLAWMAFGCAFLYFARFLMRPNVIFMDPDGMRLCQRSMVGTFKVDQLKWKDLTLACLGVPTNAGGVSDVQVCLYRGEGKTVKLSLAAIAPEQRAKIVKAIQRWAPDSEIKSDLAETLMPRQERSHTELWLQSLASPPERKSLEPLETQQQIQDGRYEVIRRLGVGGQGRAYLCLENASVLGSHSQEVVLKETILPIYVQNAVRQQSLERFQQEATMLQALDSDRIVKLLDYFIEDHRGYLVLEHVDGRNLKQLVQEEGPLGEDEVLSLAEQMAEILMYLHEKQVIHRDFTPDNLIMGRNRQLKLIDFNVAQSTETGSTGTIVGKHAYVPPEQFRGKPTLQSDIYALGATLYFLATGKDPEPITESDPRKLNESISEVLAKVISDCTKLNTNRRVHSAGDLLQRLRNGGFADASSDDEAPVTISLKVTETELQEVLIEEVVPRG